MADQQQAKEIKKQYERRWMAMKEVAAIGIGKAGDEMGIIISVTEKADKIRKKIPGHIKGIPIRIQQTGEFKAQ